MDSRIKDFKALGGIITNKNSVLKETLDWILHIGIAVGLGLFIVTFIVQITVVSGSSMETTMQDGDRVIIEKISPRFSRFSTGDIVTVDTTAFPDNIQSPIIKRVIAVEGDTVEIKDGNVYVNDVELNEEYIAGNYTEGAKYSKVELQQGEIYVMGDNRGLGKSHDSRHLGAITIDKVKGRAILRIFPFSKFGRM